MRLGTLLMGLCLFSVLGAGTGGSTVKVVERDLPPPLDLVGSILSDAQVRFYKCERRTPGSLEEFVGSPYVPYRLGDLRNPYADKPLGFGTGPGELSWVVEDGFPMVVVWTPSEGKGDLLPVLVSMPRKVFEFAAKRTDEAGPMPVSGGAAPIVRKPCYEDKVPREERVAREAGRALKWAVRKFYSEMHRPPKSAEELLSASPELKFLRNEYAGRAAKPVTAPSAGDYRISVETKDGKPAVRVEVFGIVGKVVDSVVDEKA
jgi:hypothetical protein